MKLIGLSRLLKELTNILAFVFLLVSSSFAYAQTTATISGVISDQSGNVLPGVNLTLKRKDTGEQRDATSDSSGSYTFTSVEPGEYDLRAIAQGMSPVVINNLIIRVNANVKQDIAFSVGELKEQVVVEANPLQVESSTASLGQVIEHHEINTLPLNGRNFLQLAILSPGVSPPAIQNGQSNATGFGGGRPVASVSISGARENSTIYLFDGIPSKSFEYGSVGYQMPLDTIQEFNVQRGFFSAKFGNPAVINVVSRSGSNDLHGTAYEFVRNDAFDARNFFDQKKPPFRQNQYGFSVGGPAIKNKLFWYGAYEGLKRRQSFTSTNIVPTLRELGGDFSQRKDANGNPVVIRNPRTGKIYPNGIIPASDISQFAKNYIQFFGAPTDPNAPFGAINRVLLAGQKQDVTKYDIRVDYNFKQNDQIFSRVSVGNDDLIREGSTRFSSTISPTYTRNVVVGYSHIFNPTTILDLRSGLNRVDNTSSRPADSGGVDFGQLLGLKNINGFTPCATAPTVNISEYGTFGGAGTCVASLVNNYHFKTNLALVRGRHDIELGGEIIRWQLRQSIILNENFNISYNGFATGTGLSDFLLDFPNNANGNTKATAPDKRATRPSLYAVDNIKVRPNLTLNLGLRWDYFQPFTELQDRMATFSKDLNGGRGGILLAGKNAPRGLLDKHLLDFSPRVGVAYSPGKDNKWAIRGSFGLFYDELPANELEFEHLSWPFNISSSVNVLDLPAGQYLSSSDLLPANNSTDPGKSFLLAINTHRKDPKLYMWTISGERLLSGNLLASAAYIGSVGRDLSKRLVLNSATVLDSTPLSTRIPYPDFGPMLYDDAVGTSDYQGLQLGLRRSFKKGFSFLAGYTFSKSLDTDSFDAYAARNAIPTRPERDRGPSSFDITHRFVFSSLYEFPVGPGKSFLSDVGGITRKLVEGWQLATIVSMQTGVPVDVLSAAGDTANSGNFFFNYPDRLCDGRLPRGQRTPERWFDTKCFAVPSPFTFGNAGAKIIRTDGIRNVDLSLIKNLAITERVHTELRAEFFNVFNFVNFNAPNTSIGSATAGKVFSAQPGRIIQFGAKFTF